MSRWSVAEPQRLVFDEPVTALRVRIVQGMVNIVGTDEGVPCLDVSALEGPPLIVTHKGGTLTVTYPAPTWRGFRKWLDCRGWRRSAVVSLTVPTDTRVDVGVVGAGTVISGIEGRTEVRGVSGDTTLVGLSGAVHAETVSGSVEAQGLTGALRFQSVSGDLTVVDGAGPSVRADSVSGSMIVDLTPAATAPAGHATDVNVNNVSGEIAIRLPHPADTEVEANTTSGTVSNAFEDLRVTGQLGTRRITGRLGAGQGKLKATTISGGIALLRRPPAEDSPYDDRPPTSGDPTRPPASPQDQPGGRAADAPTSGPGTDGPRDRPTDEAASGAACAPSGAGPTDKKVL